MSCGTVNLLRILLGEVGPAGSDAALLDIGCGTGYLTACFRRRFSIVVGIDANPSAIAQARSQFGEQEGLEFRLGNAEDLPALAVGNSRFDCVISVLALHHMRIDVVLKLAKASLKYGGKIVIADIYADRKGSFGAYLVDQLFWSTMRYLPEVLASIRSVGVLNAVAYVWWRVGFSFTKPGRMHMRDDLLSGTPMTLKEWSGLLGELLPGGRLTVIAGSTLIFVWPGSKP